MLDPKQLDDLARRFTESLPGGLREFQQEVEKNTRAALQGALARMDLITRDEFDAQAKVLARTRARVEELEGKLKELEERLSAADTGSKSGGRGSRSGATRKGAGKQPGGETP